MMPLLAAALLTSTAVGYLLASILLPVYKPAWADVLLRTSLGIGLGMGVTSCFFFLDRVLIGPSIVVSLITEFLVLAAVVSAFWFTRDVRPRVTAIHANPRGYLWWLLPLFFAALGMSIFLFINSTASNLYGAWDAWAIWNQRAKFFAQPDASWRRAFSPLLNQVAGAGATHPDYPMLLSGYIARCWSWMGSIGDVSAPIAVAALFSAATIGVLVSALAIVRSWSLAVLAGMILLSTAFLLVGPWQYADVPLGYYYLSALALLLIADANSERTFALSGLAVGLAAWTKNEGLLFALFAALAVAAYALKTGNRKALFSFTAGALVPLAITLYFQFGMAPATGTYAHVSSRDMASRAADWSRYVKIAKALWVEGVAQGAGLANPVVSIGLLMAFLRIAPGRLRHPMTIAAFGTLFALFVGYLCTYLITPLDLTWHLDTSLKRLYVHLWPSFVFLAVGICGSAEERVIQEQDRAGSQSKTPKAKRKNHRKSAALRS